MEQIEKRQNSGPKSPQVDENETCEEAHEEEFPNRRALEELNEATRNHYVTKHGGGAQTDSNLPPASGPMDHEP